jgi:hypothetical protein
LGSFFLRSFNAESENIYNYAIWLSFDHFLVIKRQAPNGFLGFLGINVMNDIFLRVSSHLVQNIILLHISYIFTKNALSGNFGHFLGFFGHTFGQKWSIKKLGNFKSFPYLSPPPQTKHYMNIFIV